MVDIGCPKCHAPTDEKVIEDRVGRRWHVECALGVLGDYDALEIDGMFEGEERDKLLRVLQEHMTASKLPSLKSRPEIMKFEPLTGRAGERLTARLHPQMLFRADQGEATDDSPTPGRGTKIVRIVVGRQGQHDADWSGCLSADFAEAFPTAILMNAPWSLAFPLDGTIVTHERSPKEVRGKMNTCQLGLEIFFDIEFLADCTWSGSLSGIAI